MSRYPVQQGANGIWFVWSLPIENTIGGEERAAGLDAFPSYEAGRAECSRRNLAYVEALGIADQPMNGFPATYREFYQRHLLMTDQPTEARQGDRRQIVRDYHHGKIREAEWQALVAKDPALSALLVEMRRPLPEKGE